MAATRTRSISGLRVCLILPCQSIDRTDTLPAAEQKEGKGLLTNAIKCKNADLSRQAGRPSDAAIVPGNFTKFLCSKNGEVRESSVETLKLIVELKYCFSLVGHQAIWI
jgi:hypothetical protein